MSGTEKCETQWGWNGWIRAARTYFRLYGWDSTR